MPAATASRTTPRTIATAGRRLFDVTSCVSAASVGAASPGAGETASVAGTLQANGRATVEIRVPEDVQPGATVWHRVLLGRVLHDGGGGEFEPAGWPAPMIILPL